jgi:Holliday junction resolvase RusA-like endonuclease
MYIYEITGIPIPWKRPARNGKHIFDSQIRKKKEYRETVFEQAQGISNHPLSRLKAEIKVYLEYQMPIPASWSNVKRLKAIGKPHTSKPDADNLVKFVLDTFKNMLWTDDSKIYSLQAIKYYSETPLTRIYIEEYDGKQIFSRFP